jgi:hypothetical protein
MNRWKSIALVAISFNVGVVYATACSDAGKASAGDSSDDGSADDDDSDDGEDPPGDDDDGGLAELASQVTDLATSLASTEAALASLQASVDCYIGHQMDDVLWIAEDTDDDDYPGYWSAISWDDVYDGDERWTQGPNSDAMKAYEDCF